MKLKFKGKRAGIDDALVAWLRACMTPGSSLLDLGCGPGLYSEAVRDLCPHQLRVDAWDWVEPDVVADLETTPLTAITDTTWDYVFLLDVIEHLDKGIGLDLIKQCKQVVNRRIFLLTPLPEIWNDNSHNVENEQLWCHGNAYDIHKSSWIQDDFADWTPANITSLEKYYVGYYDKKDTDHPGH